MEFPKLEVSVRTEKGKGAARRLRNAGQVPGILYGSHVNAMPLVVPPRELVHALAGPMRTNTIMSLDIANASGDQPTECKALVKDHQYDPVTRDLLHVDFLAVETDKPFHIKVPLEIIGVPVGVKLGGLMTITRRRIPISCLPENLPASLKIDVSALEIDDKLAVSDLTPPEGVTVEMVSNATLIHVIPPRAEKEETTEEGVEGAEVAATAEGETKEAGSES